MKFAVKKINLFLVVSAVFSAAMLLGPGTAAAQSGVQVFISPQLANTGTFSCNAVTPTQFSATVTGSSNTAVTWSISAMYGSPSTGLGTIDANGLYTPPTCGIFQPPFMEVTATSKADPTQSASAIMDNIAFGGDSPYITTPAITVNNSAQMVNVSGTAEGWGVGLAGICGNTRGSVWHSAPLNGYDWFIIPVGSDLVPPVLDSGNAPAGLPLALTQRGNQGCLGSSFTPSFYKYSYNFNAPTTGLAAGSYAIYLVGQSSGDAAMASALFTVGSQGNIATGTITIDSVNAANNSPVQSSWSLSGPPGSPCESSPCSGAGTNTFTNSPVGTYVVVPGNAPSGYTFNSVQPVSSQTLTTGGTVDFQILWNATTASTVTGVSVSCAPSTVGINGNSLCTATVSGTGAYNSAVTWSTNLGAVSSGGAYIAPGSAGTATVTATSVQDPTKSGSAPVMITSSGGTSCYKVRQSGCVPRLVGGGWAGPILECLSSPNGGPYQIVYYANTCTSVPDTCHASTDPVACEGSGGVTCTSVSSTFCGEATPTITSVSASCTSPIQVNGLSTCNATVKGTGSFNSAVTWSMVNGGGSIDPSSGLYTAPSSPTTATVKATSVEDATKWGTTTITVTGGSPTAPTITLNANPTSITLGHSSSLTWSTTNATACTASAVPAEPDWTGAESLNNGSGVQVTPGAVGTVVYKLACTGPGGSASQPVNVVVTNSSGITITPTPVPPAAVCQDSPVTMLKCSGGVPPYTWSSSDPGDTTFTPNKNADPVTVAFIKPGLYTETCTDSAGNSAQTTVQVGVPDCSLTSSPATVTPPEQSTLSWSCAPPPALQAVSCTLNDGSGPKNVSPSGGSEQVSPTQDTTYTLTCQGTGGSCSAANGNGSDISVASSTVLVQGTGVHEGNP